MSILLQNDTELEVTKTQLARLEAAYAQAQQKREKRDDLPEVVKCGHLNGIVFLIGDLREQIADYEKSLQDLAL